MVLLWIGLLAAWPDLGAQARSLLPFGNDEAASSLAGNGTEELTGALPTAATASGNSIKQLHGSTSSEQLLKIAMDQRNTAIWPSSGSQ